MAVLVLLSFAVGYGVAGEGHDRRVTTALVTSMRNPGLALLLASTYAPQLPGVKLGVLLYVLITVLVSAVALKLSKRATSIP
jgi:bile acid:Na+ symporter, BASS family